MEYHQYPRWIGKKKRVGQKLGSMERGGLRMLSIMGISIHVTARFFLFFARRSRRQMEKLQDPGLSVPGITREGDVAQDRRNYKCTLESLKLNRSPLLNTLVVCFLLDTCVSH